jgi:DNA-nicking Smr family endonuclease
MARRRSLTPEDRRLWDQVAATARPLAPHPAPPVVPAPPEPASPPSPAVRPAVEPPRRATPPRPPATPDSASDPHAALDRANPHMDRRRFDKLRRGRLDPEARLDLHGMTSERAHAELTGFILSAHARDLRLVLVITGKGRADDAPHQPRRHGILRHSLPHWLAAPPLNGRILQVTPAHQRHGGAGAFYVYLRRRR